MLHEGRCLALDEPARLQASFRGSVLEVVVDSPRRALEVLASTFGRDRIQLFGDRLHARVDRDDTGREIRDQLDRAGLGPVSVRRVVPSLEDVFIDLLAGAKPVPQGPQTMGTSS
jgi:ABC-2 type transport system ATP-binding protein